MIGLFWHLLSALGGSLPWLEIWCGNNEILHSRLSRKRGEVFRNKQHHPRRTRKIVLRLDWSRQMKVGLRNFTNYWLSNELFSFSSQFRNMKYAGEPSIDMSLCLACEYSCFSLPLANRGISSYVATQVQQFNRVGVATTVGRRGRSRIGCDSEGKILKFNLICRRNLENSR